MFKKSIYQISEFKEKRFVFSKKGPEADMSEAEKGALRDAAKTVTEADKTVDRMESGHHVDAETAAQLKLLARSVMLNEDYFPTDEDTRIAMETASKLGPELDKNPDMKLVIEKTLEMAREATARRDAEKETVMAKTDEELAKASSSAERSKIRMTLPEKAVLEKSKLAEMAEGEQKKLIGGYERLKVTIGTEAQKIHVEAHQTNSDSGLQKIYDDWNGMGIPVNTPFYQTVFYTLKEGIDPNKNERLRDPEKKAWYMDPAQHLDKIAGEDPEFAEAYKHYLFVEGFVRAQLDGHLGTLEEQRKIGKEPISEKLVDFARSNITEIQKAVKNRDYATMAVYGAGAYAIYKCYQEWFGGDKGGTIKKALMIGGALYAGNIFMQNAGYDVMKMMGLKDQNEEVEGTPLASLFNLNMKETEGLDAKVVLRMSEVNVKDLYGEFQKVPKDGYGFIDPNQFPSIFPEFRGVPSYNLGLGEKGLNDYIGNADNKMSGRRREYVKMGNQLYILALSMRSAYEKTIQAESGVPFEKALEDPTIGKGKVRNFLEVIEAHAPSSLDAPKDLDKVEGALKGAFDGDVGFSLDRFAEKAGHYQGTLLSYPVVYVYDSSSKSYRVYLKPNYGGKDEPGTGFMARIPADPASPTAKLEGAKALAKVEDKVEELVKKNGKNDYAVKLEDGKWYATVKFGSKAFGIEERTIKNEVTFGPLGDVVNFDNEKNALEGAILDKIMNQPEFAPLRPFANTKRVEIKNVDDKKKECSLIVGKSKIAFSLKFEKDKFVEAGSTEALKNPLFVKDYIEALNEDGGFEINTLVKEIESEFKEGIPENYVSHFINSLTGEVNPDALDGFNLDIISGAAPEKFSQVILQSTKATAMYRLRSALYDAKKIGDIDTIRDKSLADMKTSLQSVLDVLRSHEEDWDRGEYMARVIDPLRKAGSISNEYSKHRAQVEGKVYSLALPNAVLRKSDFSDKSHNAASELIGVFAYYTAGLDYAGLDSLTYPPTPTPLVSSKLDPALEGHFRLNYFKYVESNLIAAAKKRDSLSVVPDPTSPEWGIMKYGQWKEKEGTYRMLDPIDENPPFKHDVAEHAKGEHTELDVELSKAFRAAASTLQGEYGSTLNWGAIEDYFSNESTDPIATGLFTILTEGENHSCKLWEKTNRLAGSSSVKRSEQIKLMKSETDAFVKMIFTEKNPDGSFKFFAEKPTLGTRILMKFPWLADVPGLNSLL